MNEQTITGAIEPAEWFVCFHRRSLNPVLSFLARGEFKHVSAFGYCHTLKVWLLYDAQFSGTKILLIDKQAALDWSRDCAVLKISPIRERMGYSSRLLFTCVAAVKHLIGLRCVAATPTGLYRQILSRGGTVISAGHPNPATDAGRSEPGC